MNIFTKLFLETAETIVRSVLLGVGIITVLWVFCVLMLLEQLFRESPEGMAGYQDY